MSSDAKLFGFDFKSLLLEGRDAWRQWGSLHWLQRSLPASLMQVLGQAVQPQAAAWVRGNDFVWVAAPDQAKVGRADGVAIVLAGDQVLSRSLLMPDLPPAAMREAVALNVQAMSPFTAQQTLWAYAPRLANTSLRLEEQTAVEVIVTSRNIVAKALQEHAQQLTEGMDPEVWGVSASVPLMLCGFGEQRRLAREARQRSWLLLGGAVAILLAVALAVTPIAQLRLRAIDASAQFDTLAQGTAEVVAKRQTLVAEADAVAALVARQRQQIDHLRVLSVLTQLLPDDTALQRIKFEGSKLILQGLSDNASEVVGQLSKAPGFRDVRLPTAVTRAARINKESFTLEAVVDPDILGLHAPAEVQAPEQSGSAPVEYKTMKDGA